MPSGARPPGRPTVLIYGHYDVQPADPVSEWRTPPFEPTVQGDDLYGRGACDDKGQLFAHVKAIEAYLRTTGRLPVNVKCLFEGEEEIGSPNLSPFIERTPARLGRRRGRHVRHPHARARPAGAHLLAPRRTGDGADGPRSRARPALGQFRRRGSQSAPGALSRSSPPARPRTGGSRFPASTTGSASWPAASGRDMARTGPPRRRNPPRCGGAPRLGRTRILALRADDDPPGAHDQRHSRAAIRARAERRSSPRGPPPRSAFGWFPIRIRGKIERQVREHLRSLTPPTVRCEIATQMMARPALVDRRHPVMRAAALAYRRGFGALPVFVRSGGTIPVVKPFSNCSAFRRC